ncbi:MAG TPA: hypothetical protein VFR08_02855, partial [Candidatus Angelobacter sp.]|nr:hypothetical protein [Candidatus Angelobacter sp.]
IRLQSLRLLRYYYHDPTYLAFPIWASFPKMERELSLTIPGAFEVLIRLITKLNPSLLALLERTK